MPHSDSRRGVCCAGNWIVDHVKTVNTWPAEETLATILAEDLGTGGSPYNVCIDLARFGADFPILALGLTGDDADGARIRDDLERLGIDARCLGTAADASTAYTDVINVQSTGRRTFFHHRGANALLAPEHFPIEDLDCRILTLGYLLLLDGLDAEDATYGTAAARVLARCQAAGIRTAVDVVSEESNRFERVVTPALAHTDYLIVNEIEAGRTADRSVRRDGRLDRGELEAAAAHLLDRGVGRMVVIHAPEGALAMSGDAGPVWHASLVLPEGFIRGGAGAGDAFFAGVLLGLHDGWAIDRSLAFAHGAAASCLRHPTCTEGVAGAAEIEALCERLGWRS
ncbi:MAG: carbohydrate kinase family protein [Planctomycetota bacterium]|jgi:sugar/nucleoside kinase (ribokinase family)